MAYQIDHKNILPSYEKYINLLIYCNTLGKIFYKPGTRLKAVAAFFPDMKYGDIATAVAHMDGGVRFKDRLYIGCNYTCWEPVLPYKKASNLP